MVVVAPHNMRDEWMECARRRPVIESVCVRRPAGAVAVVVDGLEEVVEVEGGHDGGLGDGVMSARPLFLE